MSERGDDGRERLAPVTYLPGIEPSAPWTAPFERSTAYATEADVLRLASMPPHEVDDHVSEDREQWEAVEDALARRLRRSGLSEREARAFLAQRDVDGSFIDALIELYKSRAWIDDVALADQLVHVGTDRKSQGRRAIAMTLSQRGIPQETADAALASLPDDDAERALEYARSRAHRLRDYDFDTALRRLMGQIVRRGYSGSVASTAARTALTEQRGSGGVVFR